MFIPASVTPKASIDHQVLPRRAAHLRPPEISSTIAAERHPQQHRAARAESSNKVFASAAPNCTEVIASRTRTTGARTRRSTAIIATWHAPAPRPWPRALLGGLRARLRRRRRAVRARRPRRDVGERRARCSAAPPARRSGWRASRCAAAALLEAILAREPGFRGLMTFTLPESALAARARLRRPAARLPDRRPRGAGRAGPPRHRAAADRDGRLRRPPRPDRRGGRRRATRDPGLHRVRHEPVAGGRPREGRRQALAAAHARGRRARSRGRSCARPGFELAGMMGYEAHIAGVGDKPLGKHLERPRDPLDASAARRPRSRSAARRSWRRCARSRRVEFVNGGGTGSIHSTAREQAVTEVTAGSGFYAPTLFDRYSDFTLTPGGDVRAAGGAAAERRRGDAARRRLPRLGRGRRRPPAAALPARPACAWTRARAPARCRRR